MLLHQFGIDDARHDHREIGNGKPVLAREIDAEGVVVDDDELFGLGERTGTHLKCGEAADADGAIERPLHVLGGDRRAVLEGRLLLQFEGDRHVADVHVFGELGLELVLVVIRLAVRTGLHLVTDEAVVAIPRHFVSRHVGADAVNVEIVGAAFRDDQQRLLARLRLGRREHRRRGHCSARSQGGYGFQKITTFHRSLPNMR